MQKNKILVILLIALLLVSGCVNKKTDAYKFKTEYESLNNTKSKSGKAIRNLKIDSKNPFIYKTEDDIIELIDKKDTFVVYFGFASCPWCRSVLPTLIDVAKEYSIENIYYVDVLDIRDVYEIGEDGKLKKTKDGTKGYNELVKKLGDKLSDYTLKNKDGEEVKVGEKRIYAPNIVGVIKGEVIDIQTGVSSLQTDGYMDITSEMQQETYDIFVKIIEKVSDALNTCDGADIGC